MLKLFRANKASNRDLRRAMKSILGFRPGNIFLYRLAFRHRSASKVTAHGVRRNNERLEYLGDAVLSAVIADYLFKKYPTQDEGFLTEMRSKIVSRASLNKVGLHMGLHKLLHMEQGHSNGGFKSVDGDALEALIGAIYLDKGYRFTKKIILKRIVGMHMDVDDLERKDWNYKSKLIDWCQKEHKKADFRVDSSVRHGAKRLYRVEVRVDGEVWASVLEHSVKSAEQLAAENAYKDHVEPWLVAHASKHAHLAGDMEAEKQRVAAERRARQERQRQQQQRKKAEEAAAVAAAVAMQALEVDLEVAPAPEAEVKADVVAAGVETIMVAETRSAGLPDYAERTAEESPATTEGLAAAEPQAVYEAMSIAPMMEAEPEPEPEKPTGMTSPEPVAEAEVETEAEVEIDAVAEIETEIETETEAEAGETAVSEPEEA